MGESVWRHLSRSRCFSCLTSDHFLMLFLVILNLYIIRKEFFKSVKNRIKKDLPKVNEFD